MLVEWQKIKRKASELRGSQGLKDWQRVTRVSILRLDTTHNFRILWISGATPARFPRYGNAHQDNSCLYNALNRSMSLPVNWRNLSHLKTCIWLMVALIHTGSVNLTKWSIYIPWQERRSEFTICMHLTMVENLSEKRTNPFCYCLDEVTSLGVFAKLSEHINEYRSNGGIPILGAQSLNQFFELYGKERGKALVSGLFTHVLFGPNDN